MSGDTHDIRGLHVIVDGEHTLGRGHADVASAALRGGACVIQLRDKRLTVRELYPIALELREITREYGAVFIVNDSVELALAVDADGVHLGQEDMPADVARRLMGPDRIIGVSTHSVDEAMAAERDGADYIGFGPMYVTATKDAGAAKGPEGLKLVRGCVRIPVVAIGGIKASNAKQVIEAGADGIAVITAVTAAADIEAAARELAGMFGAR